MVEPNQQQLNDDEDEGFARLTSEVAKSKESIPQYQSNQQIPQ